MGVNKDSNSYTVLFAIILVVFVGGLLALIAEGLKPIQKENLKNEKKQYILNSIPKYKSVKRNEAGDLFATLVNERIILDYDGNEVSKKLASDPVDDKDPKDAFSIDLLKEYKKYVQPITNMYNGDEQKEKLAADTNIHYPLFICNVEGQTYYIAPVMGKGLWAAVWGYIALDENGNKIAGAVFDHKSETPGLGAEITQDFFENPFIGKLISENGAYKPIEVNKPGNELNDYQVDGISGGTFTSVGVEEMMSRTLEVYYNYIKNRS
jgi:Na+-transporting NADH:ubiquinone oxidoreductase subunit C